METLERKREDIERAIAMYESRLAQARADLAHIVAVSALFSDREPGEPAYVDMRFLFKRNELSSLCKAALAGGPMTTRQLAHHVAVAKGWAVEDKVLRKSLCLRIVQSMRQQSLRGKVASLGKQQGVSVWGLPDATLNSAPLGAESAQTANAPALARWGVHSPPSGSADCTE